MNPIKYYPFVEAENVPYNVPLSPSADKERVIYGIFSETQKRVVYVGKAGKFKGRVATHQCNVNKAISDPQGHAPITKAIAQDPTKFSFTILKEVPPNESLSQSEKDLIRQHNTVNEGFNENAGGGGGCALNSPSRPVRQKRPSVEIASPTKNYPLITSPQSKRIRVMLTDSPKKEKDVVYRFKEKSTGKVYVGETQTTFSERISSHMSRVNCGASSDLYDAIRKNPNDFELGISYKGKRDEDIRFVETKAIEHYAGRTFNRRLGGGGSQAS